MTSKSTSFATPSSDEPVPNTRHASPLRRVLSRLHLSHPDKKSDSSAEQASHKARFTVPDNAPSGNGGARSGSKVAFEKHVVSLPDGTNKVIEGDAAALKRRQSTVSAHELRGDGEYSPTTRTLVEGVCQLTFGWASFPSALQTLMLRGFEEVDGEEALDEIGGKRVLIGESAVVDRLYVVIEGTFEEYSSQVGEGDLCIKEYSAGMAMCESALYEAGKQSSVSHIAKTEWGARPQNGERVSAMIAARARKTAAVVRPRGHMCRAPPRRR